MNEDYESFFCTGWAGAKRKSSKDIIDLWINITGYRTCSTTFNGAERSAVRFRFTMEENNPPEGFKKGELYEFTTSSRNIIDRIEEIRKADPDEFDEKLKKGIRTKLTKTNLGGNNFRYDFV